MRVTESLLWGSHSPRCFLGSQEERMAVWTSSAHEARQWPSLQTSSNADVGSRNIAAAHTIVTAHHCECLSGRGAHAQVSNPCSSVRSGRTIIFMSNEQMVNTDLHSNPDEVFLMAYTQGHSVSCTLCRPMRSYGGCHHLESSASCFTKNP